ncbi:sigma-54 dependent transcriptional regulator [Stappia sp. ES.058]|uniref:sigma-54-dependent transcriptional regulator n=1 Tax=Stappia sp. ES.058 TaxID=1881061 RepID=UPI00087DEE96|nr:sigma-54 dependent transcriptional regulator [Stappia sp. ES.058]SDT90351.1 two-component system, NtrC family, C4-dicarboxylate transport response regulator DctD [Stappia sp. ES.058]
MSDSSRDLDTAAANAPDREAARPADHPSDRPPVLIVDDDPSMRAGLRQWMRLAGFEPVEAVDAEQALTLLTPDFAGCLVTDVLLPGASGVDLLRKVKAIDAELPVVLLTGHGDVSMAVEAMHHGAADFIEKPFDPDVVAAVVRRSVAHRHLVLENRALTRRLDDLQGLEARLIGECAEMRRLREQISHFARTDASVMIVGETGTGKEVVARALSDLSVRAKGPFVAVNCAALPETMVEAELFGHEAGAFTGAERLRVGRMEQADGGVLFLDEISAMPLLLQPKLLRVLQEREVDRLGGARPVPIDVRVLSAVNVDPQTSVAAGRLRQDLLYRLNAVEIRIPPLRERAGDARLLFDSFANRFAVDYGCEHPQLTADDAAFLATHDWPGNVRELRNAAERFVLNAAMGARSLCSLVIGDAGGDPAPRGRLKDMMEAHERRVIADALARHAGSIAPVLVELDLPRRTLNEKMARLGLSRGEIAEADAERSK